MGAWRSAIVNALLSPLPTAPLDETHHMKTRSAVANSRSSSNPSRGSSMRIHQQGGGAQRGGWRHGRGRTAIKRPSSFARLDRWDQISRILLLGPHELQQACWPVGSAAAAVFGSHPAKGGFDLPDDVWRGVDSRGNRPSRASTADFRGRAGWQSRNSRRRRGHQLVVRPSLIRLIVQFSWVRFHVFHGSASHRESRFSLAG